MAREQAQVAFQNGTKKWRYKGVSADGRTKQKGVIESADARSGYRSRE